MVIYIDANVIVSYLVYTDRTKEARKILEIATFDSDFENVEFLEKLP